MLDSLRKVSEQVQRELSQAWGTVSDGWRDLVSRTGQALTRFTRSGKEADSLQGFPRWGLVAGEIQETRDDLVVRLELPGMSRQDIQVEVESMALRVRGEKRFASESEDGRFHMMEIAYGAFERVIPLPRAVREDGQARAEYRDGVLTVRLAKLADAGSRSIPVE